MGVEIYTQYYGGQILYSAAVTFGVSPRDNSPTDLQFQTSLVTSAEGQYKSSSATGNQQPQFTSFNAFINSLEQPWTIKLDAGLATERQYTTSLNIGNLASLDLTPPLITFPLNKSAVDPSTTVLTFSPPDLPVPINVTYLGYNQSGGLFQDSYTLPAGSTQFFLPSSLVLGANYEFELYCQNGPYLYVPGLSFSDPIDNNGNSIPDWNTYNSISLLAGSNFTVLPEPACIGLLSVAMLLVPRKRCKFNC